MTDLLKMFDGDSTQDLGDTEQQARNKVFEMFTESYNRRANNLKRMRLNEKLYNNQVAKNNKTKADVKHPLALSGVETMMPIIADHYPTMAAVAKQRNDVLFQDYINTRLATLLDAADFDDEGIDVAKTALIYRNGFIKAVPVLTYRKDAPDNIEELEEGKKIDYQTLAGFEIESVDPFTVFHDPMGTGLDIGKNCRYYCVAKPVSLTEISKAYDIDMDDLHGGAFEWSDYKANTSDKTNNIEDVDKSDLSILITCYWMSEGDEYEYGRKTVITNNLLLEDEAIQIPFTPYFTHKNYGSKHRFNGISETELAASSVFTINSITSHITDNLAGFGKAKRVMSQTLYNRFQTDLDADTEDIPVDRPEDFQYKTVEPVPPSSFGLLDATLQIYNKSSGLSDAMEGNRPVGITSAEGIMALREASQVRVRHKVKHDIKPMLKKLGKYLVYMITVYDKEKVDVRQADARTAGYSYRTIDPTIKYSQSDRKPLLDKNTDKIAASDIISLEDTQMDITVEIGSGLEKGSYARELQAREKYDKGVIPFYMYLDATQLQNKKEVLDWFNGKNQGLQILSQLHAISSALAAGDIKTTEKWLKSKEYQDLLGIVKTMKDYDIKSLMGAPY